MQRNADVDEPESTAAPVLPRRMAVVRDDRLTDTVIDALTEEALLGGLEMLPPSSEPVRAGTPGSTSGSVAGNRNAHYGGP